MARVDLGFRLLREPAESGAEDDGGENWLSLIYSELPF
jgi:hypothetical protein